MTTMGRHSPPIDGTVTANGHQLVPLVMAPLEQRGAVSVLPQQQPARAERLRHAVSAHRGWLAAVPIVLVNAVAFAGQLAFLRTHLPWPLAGQILVAVTLESVAVYLAWQAHLALAADDSALRLRMAAYSFAAVIGVMNYSHYMAPGWRPTFAAVTFGLMSLSSPWLWSVHSRRVSRDALAAAQQLEPHAVRLGMTRWAWHPVRSWRVMFRATWLGVTKPADAIALLAGDTPDDASDDMPDDTADDGGNDEKPPPAPARRRPSQRDKVLRVMKRHPGLPDAEVAKRAGVSLSTVQRAKKKERDVNDQELIARAREAGAELRRRPGDLDRLAGALLAELADRLDGHVEVIYQESWRAEIWDEEIPSRQGWQVRCSRHGLLGSPPGWAYQTSARANMVATRHRRKHAGE